MSIICFLVLAPQLVDKFMNLQDKATEFVWLDAYFNVKYYFICKFRHHQYQLALCIKRRRLKYQKTDNNNDYGIIAVESRKKEGLQNFKVTNALTIKRTVCEFPSHLKSMMWVADREAKHKRLEILQASIIQERLTSSELDSEEEPDTASDIQSSFFV